MLLVGSVAIAIAPIAQSQSVSFTDVAQTSGIVENDYGYSAAWGDYDGDQDPDLVVTNAYGPPRLWTNQGGSFTDSAAAAKFSGSP